MKIKERSKDYVDKYLKSSREFPFSVDCQRKVLIKVDLNRVGRAFEDGYRQAIEDIKTHLNHHNQQVFFDNLLKEML